MFESHVTTNKNTLINHEANILWAGKHTSHGKRQGFLLKCDPQWGILDQKAAGSGTEKLGIYINLCHVEGLND